MLDEESTKLHQTTLLEAIDEELEQANEQSDLASYCLMQQIMERHQDPYSSVYRDFNPDVL